MNTVPTDDSVLSRYYRPPWTAPGLCFLITVGVMDAGAEGGGSKASGRITSGRINSTAVNTMVTLTAATAQLSLGKQTGNPTTRATPVPRQPIPNKQSRLPVQFFLGRGAKSVSPAGPKPPATGYARSHGKQRNPRSQPATTKTKGSYPNRERNRGNTVDLSHGRGSHRGKAKHNAPRSKRASIIRNRNDKWQPTTSHYVHSEYWNPSYPSIRQTDDTLASTGCSTVEPTPSLPQTRVEPTPSLAQEHQSFAPQEPTPIPDADHRPQCAPPIEKPVSTLVKRDSNGTFHLRLENSPAFIEACQPTVFKPQGASGKLLPVTFTGNNTEFQIPAGEARYDRFKSAHGGQISSVIDLSIVTFCRNNPAYSRLTSWYWRKSSDSATYGRTSFSTDDPEFFELRVFQWWYANSGAYRDHLFEQGCSKMEFELRFPACPAPPYRGPYYLRLGLLKPVDINHECFSDRQLDSGPFWQTLPSRLRFNGRSTDCFNSTDYFPQGDCFVCDPVVFNTDSCDRGFQFNIPIFFILDRKRLLEYDIWKNGYLTVSLSRNTTREGDPEQASMTIPIEKRPDIGSVQWDRDKQQLTLHFRSIFADCLALVVTVAPLTSPEPTVAEDPGGQPMSSAQAFVCLNPGWQVTVPLGERPLEQSQAILISLVPDWQVPANFSLENPKDRAVVEQAEHLVTYLGQQPLSANDSPGQDNPVASAIKPCTGHCHTQLLPAALAQVNNTIIGPCRRRPDTTLASDQPMATTPNLAPGTPDDSTTPPDNHGQVSPVWFVLPPATAAVCLVCMRVCHKVMSH